jgi:hypothetical protein
MARDGDTIDRPPVGWWVAILGGLALNGAVAFDAGAYAWWCAHITTALSQGAVQAIFVAAVLTHVAEAVYAVRMARRSGIGAHTGGWFVQTLLLGFPSLRLLHRRMQES